jgi:RHS repeat-associated protein
MTKRRLTLGGTVYTQAWDSENRLKSVKVGGQTVATFTYDAGGVLVKKVEGGVTTVYVGSHYEVQGGVVVKYYLFGGQRAAMNKGGVVYYLAGDHLGTTSVVVCGQVGGCGGVPYGGKVAETRHRPYGAERWSSGTLPTDRRFTGQLLDSSLGLYQMGARWYDGSLGRWLSPDTIVPNPANPQSLNRFSYVGNNPVMYVDPTGHAQAEECDESAGGCGTDSDELEHIWEYFARYGEFDGLFAEFYATLHAYYAELGKPGANPEVLEAMKGAVDTAFQRAQVYIPQEVSLRDLLLGTASPDTAFNLASLGVGFAKDAAGIITGGIASISNPWGMNGKPDHQAAVAELEALAGQEFGDNVEIRGNTSIRSATGGQLDRGPDVSVWQGENLLKVYEAARVDQTGQFVPREQVKMYEYYEYGIPSYFRPVE